MLLSFLSHEPYIAQWGWMTNSEIEHEIFMVNEAIIWAKYDRMKKEMVMI